MFIWWDMVKHWAWRSWLETFLEYQTEEQWWKVGLLESPVLSATGYLGQRSFLHLWDWDCWLDDIWSMPMRMKAKLTGQWWPPQPRPYLNSSLKREKFDEILRNKNNPRRATESVLSDIRVRKILSTKSQKQSWEAGKCICSVRQQFLFGLSIVPSRKGGWVLR